MRYSYPQIVLQEVPGEISLALSISGCDLKCKGCHSSETWNPLFGEELNEEILDLLIKKNKYISCILFYGGEWDLLFLKSLFEYIKKNYSNLKIAFYTGREKSFFSEEFLDLIDFIKTGRYIENLGNLSNPNTNQQIFKKEDEKWLKINI